MKPCAHLESSTHIILAIINFKVIYNIIIIFEQRINTNKNKVTNWDGVVNRIWKHSSL